ncbi:UNVERIFIED_CONTAM: hypothetical protein O8I53_09365 [Campylobacter lari]
MASYIIKMTATPNGRHDQIVIDEMDLIKDNIKLLKMNYKFNEGLEKIEDINLIHDMDLLNLACEKFNDIKKAYSDSEKEKSLIGINPAMLIQIEDKYQNKVDAFNEKLKNIINTLEKHNLT